MLFCQGFLFFVVVQVGGKKVTLIIHQQKSLSQQGFSKWGRFHHPVASAHQAGRLSEARRMGAKLLKQHREVGIDARRCLLVKKT